jgi:hypothetical protein
MSLRLSAFHVFSYIKMLFSQYSAIALQLSYADITPRADICRCFHAIADTEPPYYILFLPPHSISFLIFFSMTPAQRRAAARDVLRAHTARARRARCQARHAAGSKHQRLRRHAAATRAAPLRLCTPRRRHALYSRACHCARCCD